MSTYKLICPHCHKSLRIRTSVGQHVFLRTAYLQCTNEACGATFRAQFEITHEMSPSGMPNPTVQLPVAPAALRRDAMTNPYETQLDLLEATA